MTNDQDDIEIEEMKTKDTSFSLERHGVQCSPLQYIRELTQNSIEAISGEGKGGKIFWTYDRSEKDDSGIHKLSIIDTGPGMTGEDLRMLMNQMYSSGKNQSMDGNFGIGAKIAGLYRSPAGMIYKSYQDGRGVFGEFVRTRKGKYGLAQQEDEDGSYSSYLEIPYYDKPKQIEDSGTAVTLIGRDENEDTFTSPPEGDHGVHWLSRFLNGRYYELPEDIEIRVTNRANPNDLGEEKYMRRKILGMKKYLSKYQTASGVVKITGAKMHWWVVNDNFKKQNYFTKNLVM